MATNTRKNQANIGAGEQPAYQYEPWDNDTGKFSSNLNSEEANAQEGKSNQDFNSNQEAAARYLRNAENNAISNREPSHDNGSLYTGSGRSGRSQRSTSKKSTLKGKLKGKGAIIAIAALLLGGGAFLGFSNSLLPAALSTLLTNNTQTNYTSYTLRSKFITSHMMKKNSGGAVKQGFTGSLKYASIPNRLRTRLSTYGIEVSGTGSSTMMRWNGQDIDANSFLKLYNSDVEFREAYTNARYGRAATFYDKVANKVYRKLGISRNLQKDFVQSSNAETDAANYDKTLRPKFEGDTTSLNTDSGKTIDYVEETEVKRDSQGNIISEETVIKEVEVDGNGSGGSKTGSVDSDVEAKSQAKSMIAGIAGKVGQVGNGVCTIMKIGSMIATAAAAQEMYQSINYFMAQMESISKMKAGYGDESGVNTFLNFMTTSETTDVQDYSPSALSGIIDPSFFDKSNQDKVSIDSEGRLVADDVPQTSENAPMQTETGAPVEASGLQVMLSGAKGTPESTQNYSLERIIKSLGGAAAFGAGTAVACAGVDMFNSLVGLAVTLSPAGIVSVIGNFFTSVLTTTIISVAIGGFFSFLVPTLAKIFFRNVIDTAIGVPGGQFLAQGAAAANMSSARRGSGQSPSSENVITAYNHSTNEVLALEAEQDRYRLSPFDTSSPNTFFGSIAYSLLPTFSSANMTSLSAFLRSTSTSLSSILSHGVSAEGEGTSYITTFGDCPLLDEIGAKGDLYCNPIVTTDMSTVEMDPEDDTYAQVLMDGNLTCDDDGNCQIEKDSNLARYITYCDGRDSPMGVVDQNILNGMQKGNTILNSIPILGNIMDLINSGATIFSDNISWANGKRCGNTSENQHFWDTEGKYYQRYVEDQRILEQMGAYEDSTNPVLAYEDTYEAEHPVDDTYLGYLSRISGLTLENTETVLATIMYYTYIDSYNPSVRLAVEDFAIKLNGEEVVADLKAERLYFEDESIANPLQTSATSRQYIIYSDIRNRSHAA